MAEEAVAETQRELDQATRRFNDYERADAKRTEEAKAAKAKAKKLRTKRDKDATTLQVRIWCFLCHTQARAGTPRMDAAAYLAVETGHLWQRRQQKCFC